MDLGSPALAGPGEPGTGPSLRGHRRATSPLTATAGLEALFSPGGAACPPDAASPDLPFSDAAARELIEVVADRPVPVRGDHCRSGKSLILHTRTTPHARGPLGAERAGVLEPGTIPARAGTTR